MIAIFVALSVGLFVLILQAPLLLGSSPTLDADVDGSGTGNDTHTANATQVTGD